MDDSGTVARTFEAVVTYDASVPVTFVTENEVNVRSAWNDSVQSVVFKLFDALGDEVFADEIVSGSTTISAQTSVNDGRSDLMQWYLSNGFHEESTGTHYARVDFNDGQGRMITDGYAFPNPADAGSYPGTILIQRFERIDGRATEDDYAFQGDIISIETLRRDRDGDGIDDGLDACIDSNLTPKVVVNNRNTGVVNVLRADGCTIMDLIAAAKARARNNRAFVGAINRMTRELVSDDTISRRDGVKIRRAVKPQVVSWTQIFRYVQTYFTFSNFRKLAVHLGYWFR